MKIFSVVVITVQFLAVVVLVGAAAIVEFAAGYYPVVKKSILSFMVQRYRWLNQKISTSSNQRIKIA